MSLFTKIRDVATGKNALKTTKKLLKGDVKGSIKSSVSGVDPLLGSVVDKDKKVAGVTTPTAARSATSKITLVNEKKK